MIAAALLRSVLLGIVTAGVTETFHHIDQPDFQNPLPRCVIIRGWCFLANGEAIAGVRLHSGKRCLNGIVGLPRPDVRAAIPSAPHDNTGFEIRGTLPSGRRDIHIEIQRSDGNWQTLDSRKINIEYGWLPLWLGGGDWTELMFFQMPGHMQHPPISLRNENFPTGANRRGEKPRLSIVTPSFQQARYLPATLRSVLDQKQVGCDYVVQDGGSNPSVRLSAWESTRDNGQADAIVRGFAKTTGGPDDLMAWINSDDFYLPGALAFVVDYFARHPSVDVVYGHRILVDENSQEIGRWFLPPHDDEVLRLNDFVPQETLFWRRRIWDKVGGLDTSFKFAMDWDLLLRFQAAGARIVRVPYFLACFRIHAAQKTSSAMQSTGQSEITRLRERTFERPFPPQELEKNPRLLSYLRRSAFIEFLWKFGVRAP